MTISDTSIKAHRRRAAQRKRRIVMHSDGQPLECAIAQAARTQVDACTYSLVHQFNLARLYRTEVDSLLPGTVELIDIPSETVSIADVPEPPKLYFYRVSGVSCGGLDGPP